MRYIIASVALATLFLTVHTSTVSAHECENVHKKDGAGTQAIQNNGGVAGFVERPDGVEVFIHPSVSGSFLSDELPGAPGEFTNYPGEPGSLPEGAHDSNGWNHVPFGG